MRIARVFPRKTKASPTDDMAFFGPPPMWGVECDEVHISVAFTWDIPKAEQLEKEWRAIAPVKIGGPALGKPSGDFEPGMYLKHGYTITSRGCPNRCWFCSVWKREPKLVELPIKSGWNVLDDNLLACSETHIRAVFAMLRTQNHPVEFTGGLEAKILKDWHIDLLAELKPKQMFFAYDTEDDREPLEYAATRLLKAGFTVASHSIRAFVLIGYPKDTIKEAEGRLEFVRRIGMTPCAMLWRDHAGSRDKEWTRFQRKWARPSIVHGSKKKEGMELFN